MKQRDFIVWWTPTTMTSQTGGRLRAFSNSTFTITCWEFYSYLSPVSDFRKQFISQVFFFHVSNPYNCFICKSHFTHFISFFNFLVHFLTWKLYHQISLQYISFSTIARNVTFYKKIFSTVWNENKKTKKTRTSCVLSFLLENPHNQDLKLTTL